MSVSSDGILCYGFKITDEKGSEVDLDLPYLEDFDALVLSMSSLKEPDNFDNDKFDLDPEYKKIWREYWEAKKVFLKEIGVTLVHHCSYDYPEYILAASKSVITAARGYPEELGQDITKEKEWRQLIFDFCCKSGILFKEPQFILCSMFG